MPTIERVEADEHLNPLLDQVAHGKEVIITKNGMEVARVLGIEPFNREKVRAALARLRELRVGTRLNGLSIKDLITEGRR